MSDIEARPAVRFPFSVIEPTPARPPSGESVPSPGIAFGHGASAPAADPTGAGADDLAEQYEVLHGLRIKLAGVVIWETAAVLSVMTWGDQPGDWEIRAIAVIGQDGHRGYLKRPHINAYPNLRAEWNLLEGAVDKEVLERQLAEIRPKPKAPEPVEYGRCPKCSMATVTDGERVWCDCDCGCGYGKDTPVPWVNRDAAPELAAAALILVQAEKDCVRAFRERDTAFLAAIAHAAEKARAALNLAAKP